MRARRGIQDVLRHSSQERSVSLSNCPAFHRQIREHHPKDRWLSARETAVCSHRTLYRGPAETHAERSLLLQKRSGAHAHPDRSRLSGVGRVLSATKFQERVDQGGTPELVRTTQLAPARCSLV